jgi:hypothetical protein
MAEVRPKPEPRRPKEIRNPKAESRLQKSLIPDNIVRSLPLTPSLSLGERESQSMAYVFSEGWNSPTDVNFSGCSTSNGDARIVSNVGRVSVIMGLMRLRVTVRGGLGLGWAGCCV